MDDEKLKFKLKLASIYVAEGKNLHAVQVYQQLLNISDNYDPYFLLAELYENMGFVDAAINLLSGLNSSSADNKEVSFHYGQFLLRNAKWIEAIQVLDNIKSSNPYVLFLIAYSYLMMNEYELSKEYFTNYINSEGQSELKVEANLYLAKIEYELKNYNSALDFATKAQFVYSDFWELNLTLAKIYYSLKMYNHALAPIQKALRMNADDATVQEFAGRIFYESQEFEKAIIHFSKTIDLSSEITADIYTLLAKSFLKNHKLNEAEMFFDLALKLDPGFEAAINGKKIINKNS